MPLLLKAVIKNIYKNKFYAFILFFFSINATSIYLSSENLKSNIDKSLLPFKSKNNTLHDFVITSKNEIGGINTYSLDDSFYTRPQYSTDTENLYSYANVAWKFKPKGNYSDEGFVKKITRNQNTSGGSSNTTYKVEKDNTIDSSLNLDIKHAGQKININPLANTQFQYHSIQYAFDCPGSSGDFFTQNFIHFNNQNDAYFKTLPSLSNIQNLNVNNFNKPTQKIVSQCMYTKKYTTFEPYKDFFIDLLKYFYRSFESDHWSDKYPYGKSLLESVYNNNNKNWIIEKDSSGNKIDNTQENSQKLVNSDKEKWVYTAAEKKFINSNHYHKTYWLRKVLTADQTLSSFLFPFVSKENYIKLKIPFYNRIKNNKNINPKWKELINEIKTKNLTYKFPKELHNFINSHINNEKLFDDIEADYFFSNFANTYTLDPELNNITLIDIPGIEYKQQLFMLHKLLLWDYIDTTYGQATGKKSLSEDYFSKLKANNYAKLIGFLEKLKTSKTKLTYNKVNDNAILDKISWIPQEHIAIQKMDIFDYIFDNIEPEDLNKKSEDFITDSNKKSNYSTFTKELKNDLIDNWKKWIKNETLTNLQPLSNKKTTTTNTNQKESITNFKTVFEKLQKHISNQLLDYIENITKQKLIIVKDFFNNNNLFKLSFLIYKFNFDANQNLNIPKNHENYKQIQDLLNDLQFNVHKSVVVGNIGNISAKLNDPNKLNHKFKIINKNNSQINDIHIVEGNKLPQFNEKYIEVFEDFIRATNIVDRPSYEFKNLYEVLYKSKLQDSEYNTLFKDYLDYYASPKEVVKGIFQSFNDLEKYRQAIGGLRTDSKPSIKGSKITFELKSFSNFSTTRTVKFNFTLDKKIFGYIEQPTANFAIISPEYAKINNIKPISNEQFHHFQKLFNDSKNLTQDLWEREYKKFIFDPNNKDHILNINNTHIIIVGLGVSPDYIFPNLSWIDFIPSKEKEAMVYMDEYGYKNIAENQIIDFFENYISFKYPESIVDLGMEKEYIEEIQNYIHENVGKNYFELTSFSDDSPQEHLFSIRTKYSDLMKTNINNFSNSLLFMIFPVIAVVIYIMSKKYIQKNINIFGNFIANGIPKTHILIASSMFIALPVFAATVAGIGVSLFSQSFIFDLISNFWFLPTSFKAFHVGSFLINSLKFVGIITSISLISSFLALKPNVTVLLKENSSFKNNNFFNYLMTNFIRLSALWKFRLIVILNGIKQMIVITTSSITVFLLIGFLWHNWGKIDEIAKNELNTKLNGYQIDYSSPTEEGEQYTLSSYFNLGKTIENKIEKNNLIVYGKENDLQSVNYKTSKDNPELIMSNLNSIYYGQDIKIFDECLQYLITTKGKEEAFKEFNKKYMPINSGGLSKNLQQRDSDKYLNRSFLVKKNSNKPSQSDKCAEISATNYEAQWAKTKPLLANLVTPFYAHQREITKVFQPVKNAYLNKGYNMATYIPVEQEFWSGGEQGVISDLELFKKTTIEKYGNEPLFKDLDTYYKTHKGFGSIKEIENERVSWYLNELNKNSDKPAGQNTLSKLFNLFSVFSPEKLELRRDFWKYTDNSKKDYYFPTLHRLSKDNANYLTINMNDLYLLNKDMSFFKNKVIIRILLDHSFEIRDNEGDNNFNLWTLVNDGLKSSHPELLTIIDKNHYNFISAIIKSKYGKFFVERFMTEHSNTSSIIEQHVDGNLYNKKPSYIVDKNKMDNKFDKANILKGLYFLDPKKVFYFYNDIQNLSSTATSSKIVDPNIDKHSLHSLTYRPDFLYLFYALMNDKEFIKKTKPIKFAFNYSSYNLDYADITKEFNITGDTTQDDNKGILSENTNGNFHKVLDSGDQTYTYLNGNLKNPQNNLETIKIFGLKKDSRGTYFKLLEDEKPINHLLYAEVKNDEYPIVINKFAEKYFNIPKGSVINYIVINTFDRHKRKIKDERFKVVKLKVVGVYDSYVQKNIFISQKNANKILGLSPDYGHNGIFTKKFDNQTTPIQFNSALNIYSESGIFLDIDIKNNSTALNQLLKNKTIEKNQAALWTENSSVFSNIDNWKYLNKKYDLSYNSAEEFMSQFVSAMGESARSQGSSISSVTNNAITNNIYFENISNIVSQIFNLLTIILTPLLICTLSILTHLIIDELKNLLIILKLLGFNNKENSLPIILYLLFILGLSISVGSVIFIFAMQWYINIVFSKLNILIPITINPIYLCYSATILTSIFAFIIFILFLNIKNIYMPVAMKLISD